MVMSDHKLPSSKITNGHAEAGRASSLSVEGGGEEAIRNRKARSAALRKADVAQVSMRLLCVATSVTAVAFMVTASEASTVYVFGFPLPVRSKWSFSDSFVYLVGVSVAAAVHSLVQLVLSSTRLLRRSSLIPSSNYAWIIFAADQVFAYAMMSAGSAASSVGNLNRTGIKHTALPNFCKPLHIFCDHVAISVAFAFFSCLLLAISTVQDVIWLSNN